MKKQRRHDDIDIEKLVAVCAILVSLVGTVAGVLLTALGADA